MSLLKMERVARLGKLLFRAGLAVLALALLPFFSDASDTRDEEDFQESCELNATITKKANRKTAAYGITNEEITQINIIPDKIKTSYSLAEERVASRENTIKVEKTKALAMPSIVTSNYRKALERYLSLIDTLLPESVLPIVPDTRKTLCDKSLQKTTKPVFISRSYSISLSYSCKEIESYFNRKKAKGSPRERRGGA